MNDKPSKKICIVGGVAGGAGTAARLRRLDENAEIILFERGEYISYANCGLPYHVGGVIQARENLLLNTPAGMNAKFKLDVRVQSEVVKINRAEKTIEIRDHRRGVAYEESYDVLVLSTGSSPLVPPIPGIDGERIYRLWTVPDTDRIRAAIEKYRARRAAVIGGGFIGLEMAENLRHRGIGVTIIEAQDQVFAPFDSEMAEALHGEIRRAGVELILSDAVESFKNGPDGVTIKLKSGAAVEADFVVLSIGVRPNSELARDAGLTLNPRGGIVADDRLQTSDPAIYALGDVIEVRDRVDGEPAMIPLAGPANKQARILADRIHGIDARYRGTLGASIVKLFSLSAAAVGHNEKALKRAGKVKGTDYRTILIRQNDHAGYYPGATPIYLKLIFTADGKRILGAQLFGEKGVDKRVDVLSAAMQFGASPVDLKDLELAYAPPFSSAKDPVNMLGFVAENVLNGLVSFAEWNAVETSDPAKTAILDVREDFERAIASVPGAIAIPLGQLRARLSELDPEKEIVVFCAAGVRAHTAARILTNHGFRNVKIYPGGEKFYALTHPKKG